MRIAGKNRRQLGQYFGSSVFKAGRIPKWRGRLSPDADEPEVIGDDPGALPKFFAQCVSLFRVGEGFAVEPALGTGDLQADGSEEFTALAFDNLKFLEALLQLLRGQVFLLPERRE